MSTCNFYTCGHRGENIPLFVVYLVDVMVSCIARSSLKHLLDNLLLLQTTMLASNADTKSILRADNSTSDTQSVPVWRLWCSLVLCLGLVFLCVSVGIFSQLFWVWLCNHLSTETRLLSSLLSSGMFNSLHWYTAQYHYITTPTATTTHFLLSAVSCVRHRPECCDGAELSWVT